MTFSRLATLAAATCALLLAFAAPASADPPVNDNFADAASLSLGSSTIASNVEATVEPGESSPNGWNLSNSVWYSITAPADGEIGLSVCTSFPNNVMVLKGDELGLLELAATDPPSVSQMLSPQACSGGIYPSMLEPIRVHQGDVLKLSISAANPGQSGSFVVLAGFTAAPANDNYGSRAQIRSRAPQTGSNAGASTEANEPSSPFTGHRSVWYEYRGLADTTADVEVCADFPVTLEAFSNGPIENLTPTTAAQTTSPGGCDGGDGYLVVLDDMPVQNTPNLGPGTAMKIRVSGASGDSDAGDFEIEVRQNGAPANDTVFLGYLMDQWGAGTYTEYSDNTVAADEPSEFSGDHFPSANKSVYFFAYIRASGEFTFDTCGTGIDTVSDVFSFYSRTAWSSNAYADGGCASGGGDRVPSQWGVNGGVAFLRVRSSNAGAGGPIEAHFTWDPEVGNNNFAGAQTIGGGEQIAGTNKGSNTENDEPSNASGGKYRSVWYKFTPPSDGVISFDTCETEIDTVVTAWTGAGLQTLAQLGGDGAVDNGCDSGGGSALRDRAVTAGETVYFQVDGASASERGDFTAALDFDPVPANDDFADALEISGESASLTWTNKLATLETNEPKTNPQAGRTLWYSWTAPRDGFVSLSACNSIPFDSSLGIYTGSAVDSLVQKDAAVDNCGGTNGARIGGQPVIGGETYRIQVGSENNIYYGVDVPLTLTFTDPQPNDFIADAADLGSSNKVTVTGSNLFASSEANEPTIGGLVRPASVWYKWTASITADYELDTCSLPTDQDTFLAVFDSPVASPAAADLSLVTSDSGGCGGDADGMGKLTLAAAAGKTYWIAIANVASSSPPTGTDFTLKIRTLPHNTAPPVVTGEAKVGQELSATGGSWLGSGPFELDYQWLRCDASGASCSPISGADDNQYVVASADNGSTLRMRVTAEGSIGSTQAVSEATDPVSGDADQDGVLDDDDSCPSREGDPAKSNGCPHENILITGAASLSGTEALQHTLTVSVGAASNSPGYDPDLGAPTPQITWYSCETASYSVSTCRTVGDDGATYAPVESLDAETSDGNRYIRAVVKWTNGDGAEAFSYGAATAKIVDNCPTTLQGADKTDGCAIVPILLLATPAVYGSLLVGEELHLTDGFAENDVSFFDADLDHPSYSDPALHSVTWQRCTDAQNPATCNVIGEATDPTYTATAADAGKQLRAIMTWKNGAGGGTRSAVATSGTINTDSDRDGIFDEDDTCPLVSRESSGKANGCPREVIQIDSDATISGVTQVGQTLTGHYAFSAEEVDPDVGEILYTFSWMRCEAPDDCTTIEGAESSTYKLTAADLGKTVKFRANADNGDSYELSISEPTEIITDPPAPPVTPSAPDALDLSKLKLPKKASFKGIVKKKGKFTIKSIVFACPAGGATCKISLSYTAKIKKKTKKLGSSTLTIPAGQSKPLSGKLSSSGLKLLKANKKLKVTIAMKGSGGGAGKATFKEFTVTK